MVILHRRQSLQQVPGKKISYQHWLTASNWGSSEEDHKLIKTWEKTFQKKFFSFNKVSKISVAVFGWDQIILGFS